MITPDKDLAARIAVIKQEFLTRLRDEVVPNLRKLRQDFLAAPGDESVRDRLLHAAHDMNGSGAMFGYDALSDDGRRLETALRALAKRTGDIPEDSSADVVTLIDRLDATCVEATRDLKPTTS